MKGHGMTRKLAIAWAAILMGAALAAGCRGGGGSDAGPYTPDGVARIRQNLKYHKLILLPFTVSSSVEEPGTAPADCHKAAVDFLTEKGVFASIQTTAGAADADTLRIEGVVQQLRIVSGGARFWGRQYAGSSNMTIYLIAKDGAGAPHAGMRTRSSSGDRGHLAAKYEYRRHATPPDDR